MRLTTSDRDAFVNAVMKDVPQIDYREQAYKLVRDYHLNKLPPEVRKAVKTLGEGWFKTNYVNLPSYLGSCYCITFDGATDSNPLAAVPELLELNEQAKVQDKARGELRRKVHGAIAGCATLKQAKDRLPEFEKYLPKDRDGHGTANLPAISNVVAELTKAGWPKGEQ